jgi:hypothetical protein
MAKWEEKSLGEFLRTYGIANMGLEFAAIGMGLSVHVVFVLVCWRRGLCMGRVSFRDSAV